MDKKKNPEHNEPPKPSEEDLKKMNIRVNEFGQIIKDYDVDDINAFLDENVQDKKMSDEK